MWYVEHAICDPQMEETTMRKHCSLSVKDFAPLPEQCNSTRAILKLEGKRWFFNMSVHSDCQHNELRSLGGRVLRQTPTTQRAVIPCLLYTAQEVALLLGCVSSIPAAELPYHFPPSKRKLYSREGQSVLDVPLSPRDWFVKAFVKCEKIQILEKRGDPRMIQARSPRFNAVFGRYTRAIEHRLYEMRDPQSQRRMIAKGLNQYQRAQLLVTMHQSFEAPIAVSCDLSRFDMHVSVEQLKIVHWLYLQVIPSLEFQELLEKQLRNQGRTSNGVRYQSEGGVMSGDMTTALGNCLLLVIILMTLRRELQGNGMGRMEFVVDGDDHVIMVEKRDAGMLINRISEFFTEVGHELKVEGTTEDIREVEFCQTRPIRVRGEWVMMPNPRKVLATSFVVSRGHWHHIDKYLGTIWEARALLHAGMPCLGPLFHRLSQENMHRMHLTEGGWRAIFQGLDFNLRSLVGRRLETESDVDVDARVDVAVAWNLSVPEQMEAEEMSVTLPPKMVPAVKWTRVGRDMEPSMLGYRVIRNELQSVQADTQRMYMREGAQGTETEEEPPWQEGEPRQ